MSRWVAYTFGIGVALAVASPAFSGAKDSYPLSTYPMFATKRESPRLYVAEGVSDHARRARLPPALLATDEVMQAAALVRRAVHAGDARMRTLCEEIAARVTRDERQRDVAFVELTSAEYEPVAYFVSGAEPRERIRHYRCAVPRKT
ncbi:MAG TPA: hypothetical protein VK524_12470 [Polyangiaceae bacterium]|nr:hypothetical protein [Polyangiaceae bacterium]